MSDNKTTDGVTAPETDAVSPVEGTPDSTLSSANETKAYDTSALVAAAFETSDPASTGDSVAPAAEAVAAPASLVELVEPVEPAEPVVTESAVAPTDLVESANESLASVTEAVSAPAPISPAPAAETELSQPVAAESVKRETYIPSATIGGAVGGAGAATLAATDAPTAYVPGVPAEAVADAPTAYVPGVPVAAATVPAPLVGVSAAAPAGPTPIYVQAPTPPTPAGNRGGGILIALIATVAYAVLFAIAAFVIAAITSVTLEQTVTTFSDILASGIYYIPVIFFFIGFSLLIAIVNRGGWWAYVLFSFLVAVIVYFSYIGGALLTVQAWTMTPSEAAAFISTQWLHPFAIVSAVIAREVPIWFGAWIAARGRKVTARNIEARQEYDRLINEGPQLTSPF
jgi:hypothetical protein